MSSGADSGRGPASGAADPHSRFMRHALELAGAGWGRVHPNPLVGAVVVKDDRIVGTGAHREFGGPHAEVDALAAAGEAAAGATLYVTLEPCAHHGKTPPCTQAILDAGLARVVYAVADPNPAAGGGAEALRAAGVDVVAGVEEEAARARNALFLAPFEGHDPFVALKYGLSLDGRLGRVGERTRVTGPDAEWEVHRLRAGFDAVLVGGTTARVDDPLLTVRHGGPPRKPPVRLIADPGARLPPGSRLARSAAETPVWVLAASDADPSRVAALEAAGVRALVCPSGDTGLDLRPTLELLAREGLHTILCEGGGRLGCALLAAGALGRLYLFIAPVLFGDDGVAAFPLTRPAGAAAGAAAGPGGIPDRLVEARPVGDDVMITLDRRR